MPDLVDCAITLINLYFPTHSLDEMYVAMWRTFPAPETEKVCVTNKIINAIQITVQELVPSAKTENDKKSSAADSSQAGTSRNTSAFFSSPAASSSSNSSPAASSRNNKTDETDFWSDVKRFFSFK